MPSGGRVHFLKDQAATLPHGQRPALAVRMASQVPWLAIVESTRRCRRCCNQRSTWPTGCHEPAALARGGHAPHRHALAVVGVEVGAPDVAIAASILVACGSSSAKAMALKTAVLRRARELRNRGLQRVEAIIKRQERVAMERHGNGIFFRREYRRSWRGAHARVLDRGALAPLGRRFRVDAVARS